MITNILIGIGVVVALFLVYVASRPGDFKVSRSTTIAAPASVVFPQVNDLHKWEAWSPWAKLDPNARTAYDGPSAGVGAGFGWSGNNKIGRGHMTITDSRPNELVQFQLDFEKPMKGTNIATFNFHPAGDKTTVTWTMTGKMCFMGKLFGVFMNCDKMIGCGFDKGLADMKSIAEQSACLATAAVC
jgi:uncharacterized protein YndB with AHSA1/START domain